MFDTLLFTSVHSNLEHRLVTLTESFSPLESELHNHLRRYPNWEVRANLRDSLLYSTQSASLIWFEPVRTTYSQPQQTLTNA